MADKTNFNAPLASLFGFGVGADFPVAASIPYGAHRHRGAERSAGAGRPMSVPNSSSVTTPAWVTGLTDASLKSDLASIAAGGTVTEAQMAKVFTDLTAELTSNKAALSASQFSDLRTIAADIGALGASAYVQYITNALVNGNVANQTWTGGGSAVALGNLAAGSSATALGELTGKWFLGADNPASAVSMGATKFSVAYKSTSLPLFGANGPSASDVNQGYLGDCYLLSSLAEVASQDPSILKSMITSNGNGTYGVTFHFGGKAYYVTVDATLPNGGTIFNSGSAAWASLIEKAYAELPTTAALIGSSKSYANSFTTIGNGGDPAAALEEITGASSLTDFAASGSHWLGYSLNSSDSWTGATSTLSSASLLSTIAADLAVGNDVVLSSYTNATDSQRHTTLVADHAMSVYGYDASTGMVEIRNPWGAENGQYWDTTFEVSVGTLLSDGDWITADNAGLATIVSGASIVAASGLQAMSQVTSFSVTDTAANANGNVAALAADSKLSALTINGTSGVDAINLTGFGKAALINLGSDADSAVLIGLGKVVSGVASASSISLGAAGGYDLATLGSGAETVAFQLGAGVLDVVNFSAAHDLLSIIAEWRQPAANHRWRLGLDLLRIRYLAWHCCWPESPRRRSSPSAAASRRSPDASGGAEFGPHQAGAVNHRLHLAERDLARQIFEPAIGRDDDVLGLAIGERLADAPRHGLGGFDLVGREIEHADQDLVLGQFLEHRAIEIGLRGLDRDLPAAAALNCGRNE